jgi:large subunit ribosomal protein L24
MRIKKGDRVRVLAGKDRGKEGTVTFAFPRTDKVIVDGRNVAKKHQKAGGRSRGDQMMQGGIIDKEMPMPVSNVAIICPACGQPTRVGYRFDPDGSKVRICRKCEADLT